MGKLFVVVVALVCVVLMRSDVYASKKGACKGRAMPKGGPSKYKFYLHNMVFDPKVNNKDYFNSVYGRPPNVSWPNPLSYGVTATFEDPLTIGPSNTSQQIGVAQGFFLFDSLKDYTLFHVFTANITTGKYRGTLDIFGQLREINPVRYLSVVGGTGHFLLARGLATCKLVDIYHGNPGAPRWTLSFDLDLYY